MDDMQLYDLKDFLDRVAVVDDVCTLLHLAPAHLHKITRVKSRAYLHKTTKLNKSTQLKPTALSMPPESGSMRYDKKMTPRRVFRAWRWSHPAKECTSSLIVNF